MGSESIELLPYNNFRQLRDKKSGYLDDKKDSFHIRRIRNFKITYGGKDAKRYFIDTFCESYEQVYGLLVKTYSDKIVDYLNSRYGTYLEVSNEIATHSHAESHCWDDDDDCGYETSSYSSSVFIMVVHNYTIKIKEGVNRNALKLKHPEFAETGMFFEDFQQCETKIDEWFIEEVSMPIKETVSEKEVIDEYKKKIDFITE